MKAARTPGKANKGWQVLSDSRTNEGLSISTETSRGSKQHSVMFIPLSFFGTAGDLNQTRLPEAGIKYDVQPGREAQPQAEIRIIGFNVRSLNNVKQYLIREKLQRDSSMKHTITILAETWLKRKFRLKTQEFVCYQTPEKNDKDTRRAGGLIIVPSAWTSEALFPEFHCDEVLAARVRLETGSSIIVLMIYIPPNDGRRIQEKLSTLLKHICRRFVTLSLFAYIDANEKNLGGTNSHLSVSTPASAREYRERSTQQ